MIGSRRAGPAAAYTTGIALSLLFVFPLLWGAYSSVKGQPGSSQETGFGFDNYAAMAHFGEGVWTYLGNSGTEVVEAVQEGHLLRVVDLQQYRPCCSSDCRGSA